MNITNEIIDSINKIDQVTMEAEYNVICSLCNAYTKQAMIMEYCDDISVFQELFDFNVNFDLYDDDPKPKPKPKSKFEIMTDKIIALIKELIQNILRRLNQLKIKIIIKEINKWPEGFRFPIKEKGIIGKAATFETSLTILDKYLEAVKKGDAVELSNLSNNLTFDQISKYDVNQKYRLSEIDYNSNKAGLDKHDFLEILKYFDGKNFPQRLNKLLKSIDYNKEEYIKKWGSLANSNISTAGNNVIKLLKRSFDGYFVFMNETVKRAKPYIEKYNAKHSKSVPKSAVA